MSHTHEHLDQRFEPIRGKAKLVVVIPTFETRTKNQLKECPYPQLDPTLLLCFGIKLAERIPILCLLKFRICFENSYTIVNINVRVVRNV